EPNLVHVVSGNPSRDPLAAAHPGYPQGSDVGFRNSEWLGDSGVRQGVAVGRGTIGFRLERTTMDNPSALPSSSRRGTPAGWQTCEEVEHRNEILLAGRVIAEPSVRELHNGGQLVTWRIAVNRPSSKRRPRQEADPITCVSFHRDMVELTRDWRIGDTVQVTGALRRRFWRSVHGAASVFEVEAKTARRVKAADSSAVTSRGCQ
ncbi:MAG UNVERIFIED_CONTAM: single-stranded DNA-binding protein, partial [Thermobifida fusca]